MGAAVSVGDVLYLKFDRNIRIRRGRVILGNVAELSCSDRELEEKITGFLLNGGSPFLEPGRYPMSLMSVIRELQESFPGLKICNLGETEFIFTLEKSQKGGKLLEWMKVSAVSLLVFFGSAFTIMVFHRDGDISALFEELYVQVTGQEHSGFTILEGSYSLGLGLGILLYFNHFGKWKITADPTPMELELRQYEDNVNDTLLEGRKDEDGKK